MTFNSRYLEEITKERKLDEQSEAKHSIISLASFSRHVENREEQIDQLSDAVVSQHQE